MDIRVIGLPPSAAEREAVDSVLGAPGTGWVGGTRDVTTEGRLAVAEMERRDMLLPVLHAVQSRVGWVSTGAQNYIARRMTVPPADIFAVASFYHLIATTQQPATVAHLCDDIACRTKGAETIAAALDASGIAWKRSPCLGQCERAPAALVLAAGDAPRAITLAPVSDAAEIGALVRSPVAAADTRVAQGDRLAIVRRSAPQAGTPGLKLLGRIGAADPGDLDAYRKNGGYTALTKAITLGRDGVIAEVLASKLVGRGGAAFPTGRKWDAVAKAKASPHYLVCNADESEPGTFKDRLLLEEDPFAIIEGMTLAAYATGCERGFLYLRGEYPLAAERATAAIAAAKKAGLLGNNVAGAGFAFELEIRRGAGAYICGEETALFNSIEGKRGEPRNKPPFPVESGLFGKPTVINNVETLANIPAILREGGAAFAGLGTAGSAGPKLFCVSGAVAKPGVYELVFGTTLRELLAMSGATADIQAILLGGAAGSFVGPADLDVPLTFEGTRAIGASLGSGVVMVFDKTVDLLDIVRRIAVFFRDESCGQCVPCRVGTVRQEELLARLRRDRPLGSKETELALLRELGQAMRDASICGLGQTASSAIESFYRKGLA